MKVLEHRRHAMRQDTSNQNSTLSKEGISLAKSLDNLHESYDLVVTSERTRAKQTAKVLNLEIDYIDSRLNTFSQSIEDESPYPWTFDQISKFLKKSIHFQNFVDLQLNLYSEIFDKLPLNGIAMLVSHGGVVDIPLVALFPDENHSAWDPIFSYCEGFRVYYSEAKNEFMRYEILRVSNFENNVTSD